MIILCVNVGSSTIKYSVFERGDGMTLRMLNTGTFEGVHTDALFADHAERGVPAPQAIGHRIVHGGPNYFDPVRLTAEGSPGSAGRDSFRTAAPAAGTGRDRCHQRAASGDSAGALLRYGVSPAASGNCQTISAAGRILDDGGPPLRFPWAVLRIHRQRDRRRNSGSGRSSRIWAMAPAWSRCSTDSRWKLPWASRPPAAS